MFARTVNALREAERRFIPRTKVNALKFLWDVELDDLKQKAMRSHKLWVESGKPRSGSIFDNCNRDKYSYRALISQHKTNEKISVSSDLHECLLGKNTSGFWETWETKVCESKHSMPCIDGCNDEYTVNNKFVDYFKNACTVNSVEHDATMRDKLHAKLNAYSKSSDSKCMAINAELIGFCIDKLHGGKAPGKDRLQTEHLIYSHPILYVILSKLFEQFLKNGFVPASFGQGLLIPIPEDAGNE